MSTPGDLSTLIDQFARAIGIISHADDVLDDSDTESPVFLSPNDASKLKTARRNVTPKTHVSDDSDPSERRNAKTSRRT